MKRSRSPRHVPFWIGWRYLRRGRHGYEQLINWVSVVGISLGITILIVVVSIMNGLETEVRQRILQYIPHATLSAPAVSPSRVEQVQELDGVHEVRRLFRSGGVLSHGGRAYPLQIYGVDPKLPSRFVSNLAESDWWRALPANGIALSDRLIDLAGLTDGDTVVVMVSLPTSHGIKPVFERFTLVGEIPTRIDLQSHMALVNINELERRKLVASGESGWQVSVVEPMNVPEVLKDVPEAELWTDTYGALFFVLKLEKAIMFLLLFLIISLGAFNVISGQSMLVNDKRHEIAIMSTMGFSRRAIASAFVVQGVVVAIGGIVIGMVLGTTLAYNAAEVVSVFESVFGQRLLDGSYIAEVPSEVAPIDLTVTALAALVLCLYAVVRPVQRVFRESPAEALHAHG